MKQKLIYVILFLALLARLYHLTFPVGGWHAWRQADTAAIARNFSQNGYNILYPQVDWGGNTPGYVESEFQVYPYMVSLTYYLFGIHDWFGRLFSLIFSLFTIYGLYLLVRKIINEGTALWSAFIYAVLPLNVYFSRVFMPEPLLLMCIVYGLYFFVKWIDDEGKSNFILSALFITLAVLVKIVTLYIGLPLLYLAYQKFGSKTFLNIKLWLYALLVLIPPALWYYHAHQLFLSTNLTFNIWGFGSDKWGNANLLVDPQFYSDLFFMNVIDFHITYTGALFLILGLFVKRENKYELMFDFWLLSVIVYFLVVAGGNRTHDYYQLPFNLPASIFIGKALNKFLPVGEFKKVLIEKKFRTAFLVSCLLLIPLISIYRNSRLSISEHLDSKRGECISQIQKYSSERDLVIVVSDGSPFYLYASNRKGWDFLSEHFTSEQINEKRSQGAKFIFVDLENLRNDKELNFLKETESKYKTLFVSDKGVLIELSSKGLQ